MTNTDITLTPETDGTFAILPRVTAGDDARRELVRRRLVKAGIGWFLGFDPANADDRAAVETRIVELVGADVTFTWANA